MFVVCLFWFVYVCVNSVGLLFFVCVFVCLFESFFAYSLASLFVLLASSLFSGSGLFPYL